MERNRFVFFSGALWEIIRFFILFLILTSDREPDIRNNLMLMWFGSSQLTLSAGFLFSGLYPERYKASSKILALGKFLCLLPGAAVFIIQALGVVFVQMRDVFSLVTYILFPLIILCMDLIFFRFLLSYSKMSDSESSLNESDRPFLDN